MGITIFRPGRRTIIPAAGVQVWTPAVSGAFLPSSLADLWAWWDIATISTLFQDSAGSTPVTTNADPIGYIADRSGNGRYVRQTGATSTRPTYTTGVQNGLPAASFDGSDYLDSVATINSFPVTLVGFVKRSSTIGSAQGITSNNHSTLFGAKIIFASTNNVLASIATPTAQRSSSATYGSDTSLIIGARFNTAESAVMTNGTIVSGSHTASVVSNIFGLARNNVNSTSALLSGYIGEICIYNRALSDTEIGQLATYLNTKWSVY